MNEKEAVIQTLLKLWNSGLKEEDIKTELHNYGLSKEKIEYIIIGVEIGMRL